MTDRNGESRTSDQNGKGHDGGGEPYNRNPATMIARLEAAVRELRVALAGRDAGDGGLAAENARLKSECERLKEENAALRKRNDSAGTRITRTIRELEDMLGEGTDGSGHR